MLWQRGRQNTEYYKRKIFQNSFMDVYLIKVPKDSSIPKHRDIVKSGNHHRVNLTLSGGFYMQTERPIFRVKNLLVYFRPDKILHWVDKVENKTILLSVGWLTKENNDKHTSN